jgi:L-2-hydroxyglutarate oxidase LhgO
MSKPVKLLHNIYDNCALQHNCLNGVQRRNVKAKWRAQTIRPACHNGEDSSSSDSMIQGSSGHGIAGLFNMFGIESLGLTASVALAN